MSLAICQTHFFINSLQETSVELKRNKQIDLAAEFLNNTGANIFLTGRAGTGKSTFLRSSINSLHKRVVVAAPTGVAAINIGGVTLHSLFQLPFSVHLPNSSSSQRDNNKGFRFRMGKRKIALIRSIELLVIDEISMVRCDLLDAIDETLRRVRRDGRPFGGVQLLMIGDIQQLSPICHDEEWELLREHYATPYFFDSKALRECNYITVELQEIFRQRDPHFTSLLNAIRDNAITPEVISSLNERYIPNFNPHKSEGYITLTTHNNSSNAINLRKLQEIDSTPTIFTASVKGEYPQTAYPNSMDLELKVGAQVIFIKNDTSTERLYYNGLIGEVVSMTQSEVRVCPNNGGKDIEVSAVVWENIEYSLDATSGEIREEIKGSFSQLPLRCAWAITIHKSQGLSFDRAIIDANSSFAHGQVYVALSRCRTLEGMVLSTPLRGEAVIKDSNVEKFNQYVNRSQPSQEDLLRHKKAYLCTTLCELFNFSRLHQHTTAIVKLLSGHLYLEHPQLCNALNDANRVVKDEAIKFGEGFQRQIIQIVAAQELSTVERPLAERLVKASQYFESRLSPLSPLLRELTDIEPDSAELKKRLKETLAELNEELTIKLKAIKLCGKEFSIESYQRLKAESIADGLKEQKSTKTKGSPKGEKSYDVIHKELYTTLINWRNSEAEDANTPPYMVLPNRSIVDIQAKLPTTIAELKKIKGVGVVKVKQFGEDIISIVKDFCYDNNL